MTDKDKSFSSQENESGEESKKNDTINDSLLRFESDMYSKGVPSSKR